MARTTSQEPAVVVLVVGEEEEEDCEEDRISGLPDELLHTMLRRLHSPDAAARTSVLSRRWLQLWRSYPFVEYHLSTAAATTFRSFVASAATKLLLLPPDSNCAAIQNFNISLMSCNFHDEDLDRLLSLITTTAAAAAVSPAKFALEIRGFDDSSSPCYRFSVIPNWSRTRTIKLDGCDLMINPKANVVVSLSSLEDLDLQNVAIGEELLHGLLANAPRLEVLKLSQVYGIDKLEVVSSPRLRNLSLGRIYRSQRPPGRMISRGSSKYSYEKMRRLKISSSQLKIVFMLWGLEELEIDAPNLRSFCCVVFPDDPLTTKVSVVGLSRDCKCTVSVCSYANGFSPQSLRLSLSAIFAPFHRVKLVWDSYPYSLRRQKEMDSSTTEWMISSPLRIDKLKIERLVYIYNMDNAASFIDRLLCACRPKLMSIVRVQYHGLIVEYICQEYLKTNASSDGVNVVTTSWRHRLQDMKIEDDITGKMMEISEDMIPTLITREKIRFMLTWL